MASSKTHINIVNKYDRVIVLVDMDCFYCQVEEKLNPSLIGKPIAVVQYNAWRGGGIIAVNYPAREKGVTRHMRGNEAKAQCPDIQLVTVPNVREKADLTKYREAGKEVAAVLQTFTPLLERASVDEAYLDITEQVASRMTVMDEGGFQLKPSEFVNTFAVGYDSVCNYIEEISSRMEDDIDDYDCEEAELTAVRKSDIRLLIGASIASEIRAKVKEKTGYDCSAGIAHNKILAKLACGLNKPNKQTILPLRQIKLLFSSLPVGKVKGLGGKFGEDVCEKLGIKFLGDLLAFSENDLQRKFDEKSGSWLYLIARGIDLETVTPRFYSKSIGCCKKFPGKTAITGLNTLNHWFSELSNEICDRLEKDIVENNRRAKQLVVSFIQEINGEDVSSSRSANLATYDSEAMAKLAFETLRKNTDQFLKPNSENVLNNPLKFLGISVGKFATLDTNKNTLQKMFLNQAKKKSETSNSAAIASTSLQNDTNQITETSTLPNSFTLQQCDISNDTQTIPEPKKPENAIQRSFFAAHLRKTNDRDESLESVGLNKENNSEKNENSKEIKSFFLNAIKRKSTDNKNDMPSRCDEFVLKVSDDEISNDMNLEENLENNQHNNIQTINKIDQCPSFYNRPGTSREQNETDFTKNYAEYRVPDTNPGDYIKCEKCEKSILVYTMDTHMDFHFAFELSQEQRTQFRNEVKAKVLSPPVKKQKPNTATNSNNKSKTNAGIAIEKFLVKVSPTDSESVTDIEDKQRCIECGLMVQTSKILEHMDYHTAKRLQLEFNKRQLSPNSVTPPNIKKSSKKSSKIESNKSIKAFFVPKA